MLCSNCRQAFIYENGVDFRATTLLNFENIILKNARVIRCHCGVSPILSLKLYQLELAVVFQLITKPATLNIAEFNTIWKCLLSCAAEDKQFAESIGFRNSHFYKFNDFSKLDTSSPESFDETKEKYFNNADDVIINGILDSEVRNRLAKKLGFQNEKELIGLGREPAEKLIPLSVDFKLRKLVELTGYIPRYEAYSEFDLEDQQTVYIMIPG